MSLNAFTSIRSEYLQKHWNISKDKLQHVPEFWQTIRNVFCIPSTRCCQNLHDPSRIKMIALWKFKRPQFVVGANPWKIQRGWSLASAVHNNLCYDSYVTAESERRHNATTRVN